MIPKYFFLTEGVGKHKKPLLSFELALRDASIQQFNLVDVSSIIPPRCEHISKDRGLKRIKPGEITYTVLAEKSTNEPHRLITASIGVAIPSNKDSYGYLSECHFYGKTEEETGEYAEELAADMISTIIEKQFYGGQSQKEEKKLSTSPPMKTTNVTGFAEGDGDGLWTTVIAAAVFIP